MSKIVVIHSIGNEDPRDCLGKSSLNHALTKCAFIPYSKIYGGICLILYDYLEGISRLFSMHEFPEIGSGSLKTSCSRALRSGAPVASNCLKCALKTTGFSAIVESRLFKPSREIEKGSSYRGFELWRAKLVRIWPEWNRKRFE